MCSFVIKHNQNLIRVLKRQKWRGTIEQQNKKQNSTYIYVWSRWVRWNMYIVAKELSQQLVNIYAIAFMAVS
jgi:hypothetical protein